MATIELINQHLPKVKCLLQYQRFLKPKFISLLVWKMNQSCEDQLNMYWNNNFKLYEQYQSMLGLP